MNLRIGSFLAGCLLLVIVGCSGKQADPPEFATKPWPAEGWREAVKLTGLDRHFKNNLSGAHWNPLTKTLFVVTNKPGKMWRLQRRGGVFTVVGKYSLSGDIEAVTQRLTKANYAFVLDEADYKIKKVLWKGSDGAGVVGNWQIKKYLPHDNERLGPEGLAFVPNKSLKGARFTDPQGRPRLGKNGLGGLMFVAHQADGRIYVFDLAAKGSRVDFVGSYATSRSESCALEFDSSTNRLYIWHSPDTNYLEIVSLASHNLGKDRQFNRLAEFKGPRSGNLEGFAMAREDGDTDSIFVTDDDNELGSGLMWFKKFRY
ncbi:MAG: SdiA-regulated domain-containing protein [Thermodesulfobacteriota bacterium]